MMSRTLSIVLVILVTGFSASFARYYLAAHSERLAPLTLAWAATRLSLTAGSGMVLELGSDGMPAIWLGRSQEAFALGLGLRLKDQLGGGLVFEDPSGREYRYTSRKFTRGYCLLDRD